jgi:hypothetical protein
MLSLLIVVEELAFCAETAIPTDINAAITIATDRMKRQVVLFLIVLLLLLLSLAQSHRVAAIISRG